MKLTNNKVMSEIVMRKITPLITALALSLSVVMSAQADVLQMVPFQGRLHGADNQPVENGRYNITFSLYDAAVGGKLEWTEEHSGVSVIQGYTNVLLGTVSKFDTVDEPETFFENPLYVGISVNKGAELFPRQQLIPSFHAVNASKLGGVDADDYALTKDVKEVNTNLGSLKSKVDNVFAAALTQTEADAAGNVTYKSNLAIQAESATTATTSDYATVAGHAATSTIAESLRNGINASEITGGVISTGRLPAATASSRGISKAPTYIFSGNSAYWMDNETGLIMQWIDVPKQSLVRHNTKIYNFPKPMTRIFFQENSSRCVISLQHALCEGYFQSPGEGAEYGGQVFVIGI
jgi:hypothetical protein